MIGISNKIRNLVGSARRIIGALFVRDYGQEKPLQVRNEGQEVPLQANDES